MRCCQLQPVSLFVCPDSIDLESTHRLLDVGNTSSVVHIHSHLTALPYLQLSAHSTFLWDLQSPDTFGCL